MGVWCVCVGVDVCCVCVCVFACSVVGGTSCVDFSSMKACKKAGLLESFEGHSSVPLLPYVFGRWWMIV